VSGDAHNHKDLTGGDRYHADVSDLRLKRDVRPLGNALASLLAMRGVTFEWAPERLAQQRPGQQIGLIADEVEKVFPAWVRTGDDGLKRLSFDGFEALVIEALRELSQRVNERGFEVLVVETMRQLRERIDSLEVHNQALHHLAHRLDSLEAENRALREQLTSGGQRAPGRSASARRKRESGTPR
jgi:hypothetical protein